MRGAPLAGVRIQLARRRRGTLRKRGAWAQPGRRGGADVPPLRNAALSGSRIGGFVFPFAAAERLSLHRGRMVRSSHVRRGSGASAYRQICRAGFRDPARAGFTLIELLAVIAIVAILAAIVIGAGRRVAESGRIARAKAELASLSAALESYRRQHGDYPHTDQPSMLLQALIGKRSPTLASVDGRSRLDLALFTTPDAQDPFTSAGAELVDPWQKPYRYVYRVPAEGWTNPSFVLYSTGPDGADQPALGPGGVPDATAAANLDNLYAP